MKDIMTLAFTFPGQGSQSIGMGKLLSETFASSRAVFEEINDALDQNLSKLMWDGPIEDLTLTSNTQPALMACGIAACLLYTSPSPRDKRQSRMPSSA